MILIALGANLPSHAGAPADTLVAALREIEQSGIAIEAVSPFYVSPAWPDPADPSFVNAVARVRSLLAPADLLARLHAVEEHFGRKRGLRNAPRTLDLDLLDYDGRIEGGPPVLPHPRIEARGFVLVPLADIVPEWRHPVSGSSVGELIAALPEDQRAVHRLG
jgi:2-amino-4-hydroxy-6-hydroxymethyldihydropteridine diphosphokinase